ncbi:MAG: hypothetical protein ACON5H_05840 [Akkermansiaceae bacterium]
MITIFTGSTNSSQSLRETWIVLLGMLIASYLARFLFGGVLGPFAGLLSIAVLYFLIGKICGVRRKVALRICGWYLGILIFIHFAFTALAEV